MTRAQNVAQVERRCGLEWDARGRQRPVFGGGFALHLPPPPSPLAPCAPPPPPFPSLRIPGRLFALDCCLPSCYLLL